MIGAQQLFAQESLGQPGASSDGSVLIGLLIIIVLLLVLLVGGLTILLAVNRSRLSAAKTQAHVASKHVPKSKDTEVVQQMLREDRAMFQLVIDNIPQFIFWKDVDSVYLGCNQNFAKAAGVDSVDDIVGKSDYQLAWKTEEADFFRQCDRRVMESGEAEYHIIEPQLQADGKQAWLDTNKIPLLDAAGQVVGILGTFEDITERRQAEDQLRLSEANLGITLASIGDAVIATDDEGRVTRINPMAEQLTGWTQAEAQGRPLPAVFRVVDGDSRHALDDPAYRVLQSGERVDLEQGAILIARDGVERRIADSAAPIRDPGDDKTHIIGVVIVFRDVTEQYLLEEQLRQSEKLNAIGQLAGGIAHDFNNVLAGILASAELLQAKSQPDEATNRLLKVIINSAERAASLTSRLLDFSRKGKQRSELVDIHTLLEEVGTILERSIDKRIRLEIQPPANACSVQGDPGQLHSALLNIGLNARDAMPDGGQLHIEADILELDEAYCQNSAFALEPGAYVQLVLRDNGQGMTSEVQAQIFEPFFTTKSVGDGTGLGLAAVYGAVVDHHGAITVYSEPGEGTVFHVYLPSVEEVPNKEDSDEIDILGEGCILVVDDEAIVRETARQLLEALGYTVMLAEDGAAALALYRGNQDKIDAVLLDMVMPVMNGEDCFRALQACDPDVKVVICSGFLRDARIDSLQREGLHGFITKPFRRTGLGRAIALAIRA